MPKQRVQNLNGRVATRNTTSEDGIDACLMIVRVD